MLKKLLACVTAVMVILGISPSLAASAKVSVMLPSFAVTVNGAVIDNLYREYPLIVYKNITYFPMTYADARFLNLQANWTEKTGLVIAKTQSSGEYNAFKTARKNALKLTAEIQSGAITIGGKAVDNKKEEYPLLSLRGITYFPLTWRFAVTEFGWDYSFTASGGLVINSKPSGVGITLNLPIAKQFGSAVFAVSGQYIYFLGDKGVIYQASLNGLSTKKAVFQLPETSEGSGSYVTASLRGTKDGNAQLTYFAGGLPAPFTVTLKADGTSTAQEQWVTVLEGVAVKVYGGMPPETGNLFVKGVGDTEYRSIGGAYNYTADAGLDIYKGTLCIAGNPSGNATTEKYLYSIGLTDGKATQIFPKPITSFVRQGDGLIILTADGMLYKRDTSGAYTQRTTTSVSSYAVSESDVYYVSDGKVMGCADGKTVYSEGNAVSVKYDDGYLFCDLGDSLIIYDSALKTAYRFANKNAFVKGGLVYVIVGA